MNKYILLNLIIIFQIHGFPLTEDSSLKQNNPEQNLNLFEGDIILPPSSKTSRGVLLRGNTVAWTNGIIPYIISSGYGYGERSLIISTMQKMERLIAINNVACVQFRPKIASDQYYIVFYDGYGCSSSVGENRGVTMDRVVTLQPLSCFKEGIIMHELIHTLGFYHEQSRPDRDNYVTVNYGNIQTGMEYNFDKYNNSYVDTLGTPYDYSSLMHYDKDSFSKNGLSTIVPLQSGVTIGQRDNMSTIDIEEIRLFYNCSSSGVTLPPIDNSTANIYNVNTTISSSLKITNEIYNRIGGFGNGYYYEVYEINVLSSDYFIFTSNSLMYTMAFLYSGNFNKNFPNLNLIETDDVSGGDSQFQFLVYLQSNQSYLLVFTTYVQFQTGDYTLIISGPSSVNIKKLNNTIITTNSFTTTTQTIIQTVSTTQSTTQTISTTQSTTQTISTTQTRPVIQNPATIPNRSSSASTKLNIGMMMYGIVFIFVEYLINSSIVNIST